MFCLYSLLCSVRPPLIIVFLLHLLLLLLLPGDQYAESFNYSTDEVTKCRALRDTVMQLNVEAEYAAKMLEEEPMKDIIARADAINLKTDTIEKLRTLIFNTPEEKFVQLQLKAVSRSVLFCSRPWCCLRVPYFCSFRPLPICSLPFCRPWR